MDPNNPVLSFLVPEDGVPIGVTAIYTYIDADGDNAFGTYNEGDMNVLETVGLMEHMKLQILGAYAEMMK